MSDLVSVKLPCNVSDEDMHLFVPFLTYELRSLKVLKLANVLLTHSGLCINNDGLLKECHHDYPEQLPMYLNEAMRYYEETEKNPDLLIELDNENTYLAIHHPWYNYYHWLCESVFRAWMVREDKNEMILVLPEMYRHSDFIMGSLSPFKFKNIFFIPEGKSLQIKNLCLPQIKPLVDSYDSGLLQQVKHFYLDHIFECGININLGERLYISRKKAQRKKVANEEDIEQILLNYGFTIVNNEDYSFPEQVSIFANAKYLVSIHGSGLTNMLFMKPMSGVLEFHKRITNKEDWHSKAFWYMADALGHNYYQQICEPTHIDDNYFNANFIVDAEILQQNLALMTATVTSTNAIT